MKCMHCEGLMERTVVPFHVDRKGCHLSLDAVPTWVCCRCGEPYFEERDVRKIQAGLASVEPTH
jgi:YgiT-type zinc finger domain-containing protein